VVAGDENKAYSLHIDLLCFYSDYSRAALKGSSKEATEHKIEISPISRKHSILPV
jgi:hypothetical protein